MQESRAEIDKEKTNARVVVVLSSYELQRGPATYVLVYFYE